ncbi:MAG: glycoside hydrolase N-terminal domain-containing protein [Kiritimatiellae bacterium]|nr:glycoside hydrolase N-terminal domain-containing protein [Kiritimatiellia bacterium]
MEGNFRKMTGRCALFCLAFATAVPVGAVSTHRIAATRPADDNITGWERQSYPIGNGWFGVNVFGGIPCERLQVTENSFLTRRNLTNALDIRLRFQGAEQTVADATGYLRSLDLENGLSKVEYKSDGVAYSREAFTSYPDRVLAVRLAASKKGALAFDLAPEIPFLRPFGKGAAADTGRAGRVAANGTEIEVVQHLQYYDVKFYGLLKLVTDGSVADKGGVLEVRGATEATVFFSCGTNYRLAPERFVMDGRCHAEKPEIDRPDPDTAKTVRALVERAAAKGFDQLKKAHVADFSGMMNRVVVNLPGAEKDAGAETTALLSGLKQNGRGSAYLEETFFQYGRYLLVSSSRPGTLPANLQGVWTGHDKSPWGSGYWHNINVQMNYWPAFITNLAECFLPYAEFNEAFRPVTRPFVEGYLKNHKLGAMPSKEESPDIWCVGTAVYPYTAGHGPGGHSGPGTGGLTTKLFVDWWDYTRDEAALRRFVWPVVHGMADFLCRCVTEKDGKWLSAFSASPEQHDYRVKVEKGRRRPYYHTVGCAFDQQMIWENNNDLLRLASVLGINDAVVARVKTQIDRYDPVQIGESGQIKEFREEKKYGEFGEYHHRHISHLVGLYPGTLINANHPDWMAAAKCSLDKRGDKSTGWALAHRMNCRARLGDGDHALKLLRVMLADRTFSNLWDAHPPYQIDGNFGATSAVAEMLLQSQAGYVDLLPALPKAWAERGSFKGLCARGALVVDCEWKDGKPVSIKVYAPKGTKPDVRFAGKGVPFTLVTK